MGKNKKYLTASIITTSLVALGFLSYKLLKNKYPNKVEALKNPVIDDNKEIISKDKQKIYEKEDIQKQINKLIEENNTNIIIPDNYLEDEIRYQLCLNNGEEITKNTLEKLEKLDFFEIDDNDINIYCNFLSKYTNIKSININSINPLKYSSSNKSKSYLKNISPLNKLSSLTNLSFNYGIENIDFSTLKCCPNLKKLEIKFGMLKTIDFLYNLKSIEHLELMLSNNITDLTPITALNHLKTLSLYTNKTIDLNILKNIESLKSIYLNGEIVTK